MWNVLACEECKKVCGISFEDIYLNAFKHKEESDSSKVFRYAMPIGNYFDCEINGDCGIVTENGYLGIEDMASSFYWQNRGEAQLCGLKLDLWNIVSYLFFEKWAEP